MNIKEHLSRTRSQQNYQPVFFNLRDAQSERDLEKLLNDGQVEETVDALPTAVEELFRVDNPSMRPGAPGYQEAHIEYSKQYCGGEDLERKGVWVYFPWRKSLVHLPDEQDYFRLRTARNRFLITDEEQAIFHGARIGVAGLSVGSSIVNSIILSGGAGHIRINDHDTLAISNLNRLQASVCDLERNKAIACARRIYELNPFQSLDIVADGPEFFDNGGNLDLFIEETDNVKFKAESRFSARERRIPVIMATDDGDNTIIDVERFDLEPERPLFHGAIDEQELRSLAPKPPFPQMVKLITSIIGTDVTPRSQESVQLIGSKIPAMPQLGNAATLCGAAMSYIARRVLTGQEMPSGKYTVNLDAALDPHYNTPQSAQERESAKKEYANRLQQMFGQPPS